MFSIQKEKEKEIVKYFLEQKVLLSSDFFEELIIDSFDPSLFLSFLSKDGVVEIIFIDKNTRLLAERKEEGINWKELESRKAIGDKKQDYGDYKQLVDGLTTVTSSDNLNKDENGVKSEINDSVKDTNMRGNVELIFSYDEEAKKRQLKDFVSFFNKRYKELEGILRNRQELAGVTSINRILNKRDRENVAVIGLVKEKNLTKNNNYVLKIEDPSGEIALLVNKNKSDIYSFVKNLVLDEVIGVTGTNNGDIIFVNGLHVPDIPMIKELKKAEDEEYALFLSDIHVGSTDFLEEDFSKFLKWIRGEIGTEKQKELVKKVSYIFIVGDLVDGVGIYPSQEKELVIKDINEQYKACADFLSQIPSDINIIICPGNHDAVRMAEPQPVFCEEFSSALFDLPNVLMVSNPGIVNIGKTDSFSGFDVLMYHGYSFDYYIANVDEIRNNGGYDRADLVMKFLLQRRHLSPTHASSLYIPDEKRDPMVISKVPDFFATGHIHKTSVSHYRNITLICGSCWQSKTSFQEKVGHNPEPSRVPLVNLKTREVKILKFG